MVAGRWPMAHLNRLWLETQRYWSRIAVEPDVCHSGCAYTVHQTVQKSGVCSAVNGGVHLKKTLEVIR